METRGGGRLETGMETRAGGRRSRVDVHVLDVHVLALERGVAW